MTNPIQFSSPTDSHNHALQTLETLYMFDDFMLSIDSLCDLGCGVGTDLEWWATRTTNDEDNPEALDIKCTGIDLVPEISATNLHDNIDYIEHNLNKSFKSKQTFDVLWSHDSFQYMLNPLDALKNYYNMLNPGGMLAIVVPQMTNVEYHKEEYNQYDYMYHNHTLVGMIHLLATSGFDCKSGFFLKEQNDPWINCIVYKSEHEPFDPMTTRWFDLADADLLPESAVRSINKSGYVRQRDLVLPWLGRSLMKYD